MTTQYDTRLLCEMMVCPNCGAVNDDLRELDNLTMTWLCTACGWTADGADFDPAFDDNLADQLLANISALPETGRFNSWSDEDETKWSGTVDGKVVTAYYDSQADAEFYACVWADSQGYDITLQQWARYDPAVFIIPDSNLPTLQRRIDKMNRKARQLDVDPVDLAELGTVIEKRALSDQDRISGTRHTIHCTVVRISGSQIRLDGGWTFVGTLEHQPAGNILRAVPDQSIPDRFRHVDPTCDHCNLDRQRKDTFIVMDEDGTYLQVGRTCLRDYLGHRSPTLVAAWLTALAEFNAGMDEDDYWSMGDIGPTGYDADYFLGMVAAAIRLWGWTPRSKATDYSAATADTTATWIEDARKAGRDNNGLTNKDGTAAHTPNGKVIETCDADFAAGRAALQWARELTDEDLTNDYLWNVFVVAQQDGFTWRQLGLAASIVPAHTRATARTLERLDKPISQHVGTIKKRQQWTDLLLVDIKTWENDWGVTYFHIFNDEDGNCLVWKTGTVMLDQGTKYHGKATVKAHDDYNGLKQTVLTRAAFEPMDDQE